MRHSLFALIGFTAILASADAFAQVGYNAPGGRRDLGGGLVEFMLTGRDPSTARQAPAPLGAQRATRPIAQTVPAVDPYWSIDPFAEPGPARGRPRIAALPIDPSDGIVAQAPRAEHRRRDIAYDGGEAPGTIIVDTPSKALYHVLPGGRATRYGIGVGRPGFEWSGMKSVTMKKEWPDWRPPAEMRKRRPDLPTFMAGGPGNPLGARALYLGSSLYRIHGTNEPHTIGRNVSSGCIRMMNDDVVHLYDRVPVGTRVKVI